MKTSYVIKEVQNINSDREGIHIETVSLSQAKRIASKKQCFHGTVMRIETVNGFWLAHKEDGKRWVDCE